MWTRLLILVVCVFGVALAQSSTGTSVRAATRPSLSQPKTRTASKSKKARCGGNCRMPKETCVRKSRCKGRSCHFCADVSSIDIKAITAAAKTTPPRPPNPTDIAKMIAKKAAAASVAAAKSAAATSSSFSNPSSMNPLSMGMSMMPPQPPQQQPFDFFGDMFNFGGSGGGWDNTMGGPSTSMFGSGRPSMGRGMMGSPMMGSSMMGSPMMGGSSMFGMPFDFNSIMGMSMLGMDGFGFGM